VMVARIVHVVLVCCSKGSIAGMLSLTWKRVKDLMGYGTFSFHKLD
jgi:hypothetical protein